MLLAPNRRRTRHRTSSVKHGVLSEDFRSHIKLDGWKNAYPSTNPDLVPFEGRAQKLAAKLSDDRVVGFLHLLLGHVLARVAAGTDCGHGDTSSEFHAISRSKAMEGLAPQVKRKLVPTIPDDSWGFESRKGVGVVS